MERRDFFKWIQDHGCQIIPISDVKENRILIRNSKNDREYYVRAPFPEEIYDSNVIRICTRLAIEIPKLD